MSERPPHPQQSREHPRADPDPGRHLERPVVVAFPPVGEASWSGVGPVGLLRYRAVGVPALAIAVRVVSPFPEPGEPFLPGVPVPVWTDPPPAPFPPLRARELVPFKPTCDVGFAGTLVTDSPSAAAAEVRLDVRVGDTARGLSMALSGAKVDLGRVRAIAFGGTEVQLGPAGVERFEDGQHFHLEDDAERFHSAGAPLRFPYPEVGSRISVEAGFFSLDAVLGFEMFVRVDYLDGTVSLPLSRCDAITFDLDRREVEWVFRAVAVDPAEGREIERIVVAALAPGQDEARARVDAWLPHARFAHAAGPGHVRDETHPEPLDDDELTMARYATWDTPHFAGTLPIEEVAQIQVEIARGRQRSAVLEAHGLSPYAWNVEERAAMDRIAEAGLSAVEDGDREEGDDGAKAAGSAEAREDLDRYREAQARALAETPFEGRQWTVAEYADLRAALETRNPLRVLEKAGLGPAELVGLDFAMAARLEANPAERKEYDALFAQAVARHEAAAETEDDFAPPEDDDEDQDEEEEEEEEEEGEEGEEEGGER